MEGVKFTLNESNTIVAKLDFTKLNGIIPAIAVDTNGRVLMLAFMNKEALEMTLATGRMHYWSRSRKKIWMKGEESGHYQYVLGIYGDCDSDSLLFKVHQVGPACHTGGQTCFSTAIMDYPSGSEILEELEQLIADRMINPKEGSHTSSVIEGGMKEAAKKVSEEAAEVVVAALAEGKERTVSESADLVYHLLLLLQLKGVKMEQVFAELWRRRA